MVKSARRGNWSTWVALLLGTVTGCDFLDDRGEDGGGNATDAAATGEDGDVSDGGGDTRGAATGGAATDGADGTGADGASSGSGGGGADSDGDGEAEAGESGIGECIGEVLPVEVGDRRFAAGYAFLQDNGAPTLGISGRSLCLGDCLNIADLSVRSLCLAMVEGDACECMNIVDFNLRNVCQNGCESISTSPDTMNLCLGGDDCELIGDPDLRFYCQGACPLIQDPNVRYLCEGACNLIN